MLKPLTTEQTENILKAATEAFARSGFAGASVDKIARSAGVSVGVIYKYYADKQALFSACVEKSLDYLDEVFSRIGEEGGDLTDMIDSLVTRNQEAARLHPEYFRLYHQITMTAGSGKGGDGSPGDLAGLIEGKTARVYTSILEKAKTDGEVRDDMDPAMFAFLFDDLMMMLHFAYACDYYEERFRIYCGQDILDKDRFVHDEMMRFIKGALGIG